MLVFQKTLNSDFILLYKFILIVLNAKPGLAPSQFNTKSSDKIYEFMS